jgi:hypothetical protein
MFLDPNRKDKVLIYSLEEIMEFEISEHCGFPELLHWLLSPETLHQSPFARLRGYQTLSLKVYHSQNMQCQYSPPFSCKMEPYDRYDSSWDVPTEKNAHCIFFRRMRRMFGFTLQTNEEALLMDSVLSDCTRILSEQWIPRVEKEITL